MSWAAYQVPAGTVQGCGDRVHVVPLGDLREHKVDACWCHPTPAPEDEDVLWHHSMDGREAFESGERLPS